VVLVKPGKGEEGNGKWRVSEEDVRYFSTSCSYVASDFVSSVLSYISLSDVARFVEKPGKPDPPEITSTGKSTVSLAYKPPADDGGAAISNYVIEHREEGLAKWTRATKDTITKTSYTVTGLTAGSTYEFRVAAENKAGVGPPSEPSQPVAAKETVCTYIQDVPEKRTDRIFKTFEPLCTILADSSMIMLVHR